MPDTYCSVPGCVEGSVGVVKLGLGGSRVTSPDGPDQPVCLAHFTMVRRFIQAMSRIDLSVREANGEEPLGFLGRIADRFTFISNR